MNENLVKKLVAFGLSKKEAQVYLALLELEVAKVAEVAKRSGINRSTTYVILDMLKKKGLVGISDDKNVRRYVAAYPETILQTARTIAQKQQNIKEDIESAIPELKGLQKKTKKQPLVQVFEGRDGLINAFEDSLGAKEKLMRVVSAPARLRHILHDYLSLYIKERFKKNIKLRCIYPDDSLHKKLYKELVLNNLTRLDSYIAIPESKYKLPGDFAIFDDTIGYMSSRNGGFAISIQNKELANVMKSIFDMAWEEAKRLSKNSHRTSR